MALETRLYQKLSQQLVMTPQLRQAIKILQVSRAELEQLIDQELTENPVLEELQEEPRATSTPSRRRHQPRPPASSRRTPTTA
jgi:RNA polymerase sigma-54 factor